MLKAPPLIPWTYTYYNGTIMQLSVLSPKSEIYNIGSVKNKIDSDIGPKFVKKYNIIPINVERRINRGCF